MSFLEPWFLLALPLIALPVIIHLINQRRFQSMRWAAMTFLLTANRMSRGYARLRQWLILAMRVLALAGLLFVIARPLATGWLGMAAGGAAGTTIVLLDRSPSMQQVGSGAALTKLDSAKQQLRETLETLGSERVVLIDSGTREPTELASAEGLTESLETVPAGNTADLPAMLQRAYQYIVDNRVGEADIWIASDLRRADWDAGSGRWAAVRERFQSLPQSTRFHLLAYPEAAEKNRSIQIERVRRVRAGEQAQLLVSLKIEGPPTVDREVISLDWDLEGTRSRIDAELIGGVLEWNEYPIPISAELARGWGRLQLPPDANAADNTAYFVFSEAPPHKTLLVTEAPESARPLRLAAEISADPDLATSVEVVGPDQLKGVAWEELALLLWQAELPEADDAALVETFLGRGGQAFFFPPDQPTAATFRGLGWGSWREEREGRLIERWRGDADLFAATLSGTALPMGELRVFRHVTLEGEAVPLAWLAEETVLVGRVDAPQGEGGNEVTTRTRGGAAYFWATTPRPRDSTLARDGVVLYVAVQRALEAGALSLGNTETVFAGNRQAERWEPLAVAEGAISNQYGLQPGVYRAGSRSLAVRRPPAEDDREVLEGAQVDQLFAGLDFVRVEAATGGFNALVQEIWRVFLVLMIIALLVEAALCLPRSRAQVRGAAA